MTSKTLLLTGSAAAITLALATPAFASGGAGGAGYSVGDGAGGAGGDAGLIAGAGEQGENGGGAGGAGGTNGNGSTLSGEDGEDGGDFIVAGNSPGAGGGGAGGAGFIATNYSDIWIYGDPSGGDGGDGGDTWDGGDVFNFFDGGAGGGGEGGYGLWVSDVENLNLGSSNNAITVSGGDGGDGGSGLYGDAGDGGDGGVGVFLDGGRVLNYGTIVGGDGGQGGSSLYGQVGSAGAGGVGLYAIDAVVANFGTIAGGVSGDGLQADAVIFGGTDNTFIYVDGSSVIGNVIGTGTDTFMFGGSGDYTFDMSQIGTTYQGFDLVVTSRIDVTTLTETTTEALDWSISYGTIALTDGGSLGTGGTITSYLATIRADANLTIVQDFSTPDDYTTFDSNEYTLTIEGDVGGYGYNKFGSGTVVFDGTVDVANFQLVEGTIVLNASDNAADIFVAGASTIAYGDGAYNAGFINASYTEIVLNVDEGTAVQAGAIYNAFGDQVQLVKTGEGELAVGSASADYVGPIDLVEGGFALAGGAFNDATITASDQTWLRLVPEEGSYLLGSELVLNGDLAVVTETLSNSTVTMDGPISGSGGLVLAGADARARFILSGGNTYSGGTSLFNADLVVQGNGQFGSGAITVLGVMGPENLSSLIFADADGVSFANDINLGGMLAISGDADDLTTLTGDIIGEGVIYLDNQSFTFTGENSFYGLGLLGSTLIIDENSLSGAQIIAFAADELFDMGVTSSLVSTGDVTLDSIVIIQEGYADFDVTDTLTLTGSLESFEIGGFNKTGTGTIVLAGNVNMGGDIVLGDGSVELASQAATGFGDLIASDGTTLILGSDIVMANDISFLGDFTVEQAGGSATLAGVLDGEGTFNKTGAGLLTLTGDSTFAGPMNVVDGGLSVLGSVASAVTVGSGAALLGNGTLGGLVASSGATVAPTGTLSVDGDVVFESGSAFLVDVNSDGGSDLLSATGSVTIEGGEVYALAEELSAQVQRALAVVANDYGYGPITTYTIVSGDSVTGEFDAVQTDLAFLTPTLSYLGDAVELQLVRNDIAFSEVAQTSNQMAVGTVVDSLLFDRTELLGAFVAMSEDDARAAFDNLSGEAHASVGNAVWQDVSRNRRIVASRLDQPSQDGPALWLDLQAGKDMWDGDGNSARYEREVTNTAGGFEFGTGNSTLGLAIGYSTGRMDIDDRGSNAKIAGTHLEAYAGTRLGSLLLAMSGNYADFDVDMDRDIAVGTIADTATSSYGAKAYGAQAEVTLGTGGFRPFAGINWTHYERDAFSETGSTLGLEGASEKADWTYSALGAKGVVSLDPTDAVSLRYSAQWQHALDGTDTAATLAFAGSDEAFTVEGAPLSKDAALVDLGFDLRFSKSLTLGVSYSGTFSKNGDSNAARAMLSLRF